MPTAAELLSQGWDLQKAGRPREAEPLYHQVLASQPANPDAWCYLGMSYHDQQRYAEAITAYRKALELRPNFPIALNNLGNSFRLSHKLDDAITAFDKAIELKPEYLIAHKNKATTLCWEGRVTDALKVYEHVVTFAKDDADTHKHIGIMRLLLGDYAGGWPEYEWRWKTGEIKLPKLNVPLWDGSSLDGKSILLTPEQGLGDTIHFIRYAKWLKRRYQCRVLFHCPRALRSLLSTCEGIDEWLENTNNLPSVDWFAPLLHVPSVLGHTPKEFPAEVPYITADESLISQWREKLAAFPGRKIGIAWRGSPTYMADVMRSIPLAEFVPLSRLKGVHFFSLQKGPPVEELNTLAGRLEVSDLGRDLDEKTGAFVETAAVLKNLDLVITCDTAVGHVAGALGVPIWLAQCFVPDWRSGISGDTSPWYPSLRLFRQTAPDDWAGVFERMEKALMEKFPDLEPKKPEDYVLATSGFNRLTRTKDGVFLFDRDDDRVGRSFDRYGQYGAGELELLQQAVKPGFAVVEVGAGSGAFTLMLSRLVGPKGIVLAFEHGPLVFQTLCANLALNSIVNVRCRNETLGDETGTAQVVPQHQAPRETGPVAESVRVTTLDNLNLPRCHFLKIDLTGMELPLLEGAAQTIEKFRPLIYISINQPDKSQAIISRLQSFGYQLYWHTPPLFDPNNFYQNSTNEFGTTVSLHILGIHGSIASDIAGLQKIKGPQPASPSPPQPKST